MPLDFNAVRHSYNDISISAFVGHFRLSVVDALAGNTFIDIAVVENPGLPLEFRHTFGDISTSGFGWPYCYFRLSTVDEITMFELAMVDSAKFSSWKYTFVQCRFSGLGLFTPKRSKRV